MKSTNFDEYWRYSIIFVDHRRKMTLIDVVWRRLTLTDVKWRKWTSFDRRRLKFEYRRFLSKIVEEFFEKFKNFKNRWKSSKIVNFQRPQRNSSKNVMSDASSRMTPLASFDVSRRHHLTLDVSRTSSIDGENRRMTSIEVKRRHFHSTFPLLYNIFEKLKPVVFQSTDSKKSTGHYLFFYLKIM